MKKKVFLGFFCLLLCSQAFGQTWNCGDCGSWGGSACSSTASVKATLSGSTLTISGTGKMANFISASYLPWRNSRAEITQVVIQNGVTSVGQRVFDGCSNLTSITIPASVTSIDRSAINGCSKLTTINVAIDNANFFAENGVLFDKNKTQLLLYSAGKTESTYVVPNTVTDINGAFNGSLTSVDIPASVTSFGWRIFGNCKLLTSINVESENTTYSSENGVLFDKNKETLICYPFGKTGSYVIPETVTNIDEYAFQRNQGITSIIIPGSIENIGDYTFSGCGFNSVVIQDGVKNIGYDAFRDCVNLTSLFIPASITSISDWAFGLCKNLTSVYCFNSNAINISPWTFFFSEFEESLIRTLYVPKSSKETYQNIAGWQVFDEIVELTSETLTADETTIKWQSIENAEGYRLIIYSDEERTDIIYTFEFDETGELLIRSASTNFSHTIENLQGGTDYFYTLEILGVDNILLGSLSDKFKTVGVPTSIEVPLAEPIEIVGYYSILGAKLPKAPEKGVYIIMYRNGTKQKVMK